MSNEEKIELWLLLERYIKEKWNEGIENLSEEILLDKASQLVDKIKTELE